MNSDNQNLLFSKTKNYLISIIIFLLVSLGLFFKNSLFESSFLLRDFGNSSIDPEVAFINKKPTVIEFYAEWCEVCKKMAPSMAELKKDFEKDINFVFLNVDNPKWEKYVKQFNVNGIPQINFFDSNANLESTFIGLQDEKVIAESLKNITKENPNLNTLINKDVSKLRQKTNNLIAPRSHS